MEEQKQSFFEWFYEFLKEHPDIEIYFQHVTYSNAVRIQMKKYEDPIGPLGISYLVSYWDFRNSMTYDEVMIEIIKRMYRGITEHGQ